MTYNPPTSSSQMRSSATSSRPQPQQQQTLHHLHHSRGSSSGQQLHQRQQQAAASVAASSSRYAQQHQHPVHSHHHHHHHQQQQQQQQQRHRQPQQAPASVAKPSASKPHSQTWVDTLIYTLDALPPPNTWPSHILDVLVLQPLSFILAIITSPTTHRLLLRLSLLTTVFWSALALAIAAYIAFYNAWVPHLGLRVPVYLQYGHANAAPWADVFFEPLGKFFADDQQYDVTLELTVPLTPANLDLGNFMVSIDMFADSTNAPVLSSSRPTLLHPSPSALHALSSYLSRNPNPDMNPLGALAPAGVSSGPPITMLSVPLLRRAVLQVGTSAAFSPIPTSTPPPSIKKGKGKGGDGDETGRHAEALSFAPSRASSTVGIKHSSQNIASAHIVVGRSDADRYWQYGGGHGGNGNGGRSGASNEAFVSRGELQTHAVSLRFDAHLTGLRYFMYHYPLSSFFSFTTLFLLCELGAAVFVTGLFALYSTLSNSSVDVRASDEHFVVSVGEKRQAKVKKADGGAETPISVKREVGDDGLPVKQEDEDEDDEAGEADSLLTSSSALGTLEDDEDEEGEFGGDGTTPGASTDNLGDEDGEYFDEEDDEALLEGGDAAVAERAYRRQMAARARSRIERASGGPGDYEDSEDTERDEPGRAGLRSGSSSGQGSTGVPSMGASGGPSLSGLGGGTGSGVPLSSGLTTERRILGRLDEETEEETDQTATTASRRTNPAAAGGPGAGPSSGVVASGPRLGSSSAAGLAGSGAASTRGGPAANVGTSPEIGFGDEDEEEEEDEEARAERTRARWEAWRASEEAEAAASGAATPAVVVEPATSGEVAGGEGSPSASWESVEPDEVQEVPSSSAGPSSTSAAAAAAAVNVPSTPSDAAVEADDEGGESATSAPVAGPSQPRASGSTAAAGGSGKAGGRGTDDDQTSTTEEEGEEGAKTAG